VNFMMAESSATPPTAGTPVPLAPARLGAWIRSHVFSKPPNEL